ncbi:MAG TPA: potassium/proton antiporter [Kofleriaceae bacterium]|nr:potassium/proton antiporter [Kofleriaceae bacterium]
MGSAEPWRLALAILVGGVLIGIAAMATRASRRSPIPVTLLFLSIGVLAGSEGIGGIYFSNHVLAYRVGTIALILILFDGGLSTRFHRARAHLAPAVVLATIGVAATAALLAIAAHFFGLEWKQALMVAAVVSSTDAAAVFAVLRNSGMNLQRRVSATIELESGLNDPMAVILTAAMVEYAMAGDLSLPTLAWQIPVQLAVGTVVGILVGAACRQALLRLPPTTVGLLPVVTSASAAVAYGGATLLLGSGFLAVYVCGLFLSGRSLPDHAGVRRVHDFLAWLSQVVLFLTLGLLVFPSQLRAVAPVALACSAVLVLVARPIAVVACLVPFRYRWREIGYIGWIGLRGAVPIVLATYPMLVGVPGGERLLHIVFFVVLVSVIVQAGSVRPATRIIGMEEPAPPPPEATLEIASMQTYDASIACYHIDSRAAVAGVAISDVPFPERAAIMLVVRGTQLVPPRGNVMLEPGDHVYIFCLPEDEPSVALWFGQRIDD